MNSRQIAHGLEHGELEAGLTYLDNEPLARVDAVPLWTERYLLVTPAGASFRESVTWAEAAEEPAVETNSVSTLVAHARAGLPGITAHTWLEANPLPDDLRAIPLVDPVISHTIGLVTSTAVERTPVITELLDLLRS